MLLAAGYGTPLDRGTEGLFSSGVRPALQHLPGEKPSGAIGIFDAIRPVASGSPCIAVLRERGPHAGDVWRYVPPSAAVDRLKRPCDFLEFRNTLHERFIR
jgi:hypothetical protein